MSTTIVPRARFILAINSRSKPVVSALNQLWTKSSTKGTSQPLTSHHVLNDFRFFFCGENLEKSLEKPIQNHQPPLNTISCLGKSFDPNHRSTGHRAHRLQGISGTEPRPACFVVCVSYTSHITCIYIIYIYIYIMYIVYTYIYMY